eukprot:12241_4
MPKLFPKTWRREASVRHPNVGLVSTVHGLQTSLRKRAKWPLWIPTYYPLHHCQLAKLSTQKSRPMIPILFSNAMVHRQSAPNIASTATMGRLDRKKPLPTSIPFGEFLKSHLSPSTQKPNS